MSTLTGADNLKEFFALPEARHDNVFMANACKLARRVIRGNSQIICTHPRQSTAPPYASSPAEEPFPHVVAQRLESCCWKSLLEAESYEGSRDVRTQNDDEVSGGASFHKYLTFSASRSVMQILLIRVVIITVHKSGTGMDKPLIRPEAIAITSLIDTPLILPHRKGQRAF